MLGVCRSELCIYFLAVIDSNFHGSLRLRSEENHVYPENSTWLCHTVRNFLFIFLTGWYNYREQKEYFRLVLGTVA